MKRLLVILAVSGLLCVGCNQGPSGKTEKGTGRTSMTTTGASGRERATTERSTGDTGATEKKTEEHMDTHATTKSTTKDTGK